MFGVSAPKYFLGLEASGLSVLLLLLAHVISIKHALVFLDIRLGNLWYGSHGRCIRHRGCNVSTLIRYID